MRWCPVLGLVSLLTGPLVAQLHRPARCLAVVERTVLQSVIVTLSQSDYQPAPQQHGDFNTVRNTNIQQQ